MSINSQKIINRKVEINELLKHRGNNWLGRFRKWILAAHQAKLIVENEDIAEKRNFLQKCGSDFRLTNQQATWLWANPYKILADRGPFTVMSSLCKDVGTEVKSIFPIFSAKLAPIDTLCQKTVL